jgi:DNA-binding MarR family transcriptional regulator
MVLLIDELEHKGLVQRRRDQDDRRKNMVQLTEHGRTTLDAASKADAEAERRFLAAALPVDQAAAFTNALRALAFPSLAAPARGPAGSERARRS